MQIFSSIDDVVHVFDHQPLFTRVAPENLKCGQDTISHPKKLTGDKENAMSKPKYKLKAKKQEEVIEQSEEEGGKTDVDE